MTTSPQQSGSAACPSAFARPGASPARTVAARLECRRCGFEPDAALAPPPACPKCHGGAWERYFVPGSLVPHER